MEPEKEIISKFYPLPAFIHNNDFISSWNLYFGLEMCPK
jgi:hypothetical protein